MKEIKRLTDRVKELETSLATKESVKVDENKKQLEEAVKENKRLTDKVKQLEASIAIKSKSGKRITNPINNFFQPKEGVKAGENKNQLDEAVKENNRPTVKVQQLEASLATKPKESAKFGEDKWLLEDDRRQLKEERKLLEEEKKTVEEMKTKVEKEKVKVEEEKVKVEGERAKVEKMSEEQEKLVECPVCLTMPREDKAVPCCPQGHFVCTTYRDQSVR